MGCTRGGGRGPHECEYDLSTSSRWGTVASSHCTSWYAESRVAATLTDPLQASSIRQTHDSKAVGVATVMIGSTFRELTERHSRMESNCGRRRGAHEYGTSSPTPWRCCTATRKAPAAAPSTPTTSLPPSDSTTTATQSTPLSLQ